MRGLPFPKKPKIEIVKLEDEEEYGDGTTEERSWKDREAALEVLVELRTKKVEQLRERVAYYKFQAQALVIQRRQEIFFVYNSVGVLQNKETGKVALDGVVNLWQIQGKGAGVDLLSISECQSNKQRRWPEDIAWHPQANRLFSVYTADGGDSQISILELNEGNDRTRVSFLEDKPHVKGIINSINFMPWDKTCFVTGGSDHDVVLWTERDKEGSWKPNSLHRSIHTSAVMGVAGLRDKNVVMSAGADKRIIGFDTTSGTVVYKYQAKCMSVLTNPCDFNLFMVQTGTPGRQLKLIDFRAKPQEIHSLGWNQESGESQSALISQAWSPDGVCISSGSGGPLIHIFDIRHNAQKPLESLRAHHKRVLKAVWHNTLPLLISISSDLNIGLHTLIK